MRRFPPLALFAALVMGCNVQVTFPAGLACDDGRCPDGQRCEAKVCVLDVPAIDASVDGNVEDGGGAARVCGGSEAYTEDFSSARARWLFDVIRPGMTFTDKLTLDIPDGEAELFATSRPRFDLLGSSWIARVEPAQDGTTTFGIKGDDNQSLTISAIDGVLSFEQNFQPGETLTYDPDAHRFLGFRERDGSLEFVTSPDGLDLTVQRTLPTPPFTSRFQSVWSVEQSEDGVGLGGIASFDDLNVGSTHSFCPASMFRDDFEDGVFSDQWTTFSCETVEETGGEAIFTSAPGEFCVLATTNLHDLRNSTLELELGSVFSGYFKYAVDGRFGELVVERFDTELRVSVCQSELCQLPVVAPYAGERFWRFGADSEGTVTFSFSADGDEFTDVATSSTFDSSAVKARFHGNVGTENRATRFN